MYCYMKKLRVVTVNIDIPNKMTKFNCDMLPLIYFLSSDLSVVYVIPRFEWNTPRQSAVRQWVTV